MVGYKQPIEVTSVAKVCWVEVCIKAKGGRGVHRCR